MAKEPSKVTVDGVRYVPARNLQPAIDDFRNALLDLFWGPGYRGTRDDPEDGMFIGVYDDDMGGAGIPFTEFMDDLIEKIASKAPTPTDQGGV